jgi:hypothetical protein
LVSNQIEDGRSLSNQVEILREEASRDGLASGSSISYSGKNLSKKVGGDLSNGQFLGPWIGFFCLIPLISIILFNGNELDGK